MDQSIYLGAFTKALEILVPFLYWFVPVVVFTIVFRSPWFKGVVGEWFVNRLLLRYFREPEYVLFKDVLLPTDDGTTQLDHILLSPYGLFVIETKNMKGWIFGSEKQAKWTQQIYNHKSSFQNPLRQNYKHTQVLQALLGLDNECVHSLVVFVGDSTFKTKMPINVIRAFGMKTFIKSFNSRVLSEQELQGIKQQLLKGKLDNTFKNKRAHVRNVKRIVKDKDKGPTIKNNSLKPLNDDGCPKCGGELKLRVATKGSHKGTKFYGCSSFPKCRYIKKAA